MGKGVRYLLDSLNDRNLELNHRLFNLIMIASVFISLVGFGLSCTTGANRIGLFTIGFARFVFDLSDVVCKSESKL